MGFNREDGVGSGLRADVEGSPRIMLVGAGENPHIGELGRLAQTMGLEVVGRLEQRRRDGAGYLGKGKRRELAELVEELGAEIVVTDDELSASQARVLEKDCGAPVVDRTELIIRIFEEHASDRASRLEVELADLEYRLPRVKGRNPALSRLGGDSGGGGRITRGPGEQQLEYERRTVRERMDTINRRLKEEKAARAVQGSRLKESGLPTVALLGYTNAGKTTILNSLSSAGRSTKDRLFETLETTSRLVEGRSSAGNGLDSPDFVVTDTVGFIRKLPTQLVHSFASTLEAAAGADLQVICADAGSPDLEEEIQTVRSSIAEADEELGDGRVILCLNKVDLLPELDRERLLEEFPDAVVISALSDVVPLLERIREEISAGWRRIEILIPHSEYGEASRLHGRAEIHASEDTEKGVLMEVSIPPHEARRYSHYRTLE